MASTFTGDLRLELMATGENDATWGTKANTNVFQLLEDALTAETAISTTGGTDVLTANNGSVDQARAVFLDISGTLASNSTIEIPDANKFYLVQNATTGSFTVTIKTNGGSGQAVTQGNTAIVYCDATDTVRIGVEGDLGLTSIADLTTAADEMIYTTALDVYATTALTSFARTLLDDTTQGAMQTTLGLVPGTDVQTEDAVLTDLSALSAVADNEFIVGTGAGTYAHENPATARASMGVVIGTDVQAEDAVLTDLAALTAVANNEFIVGTGAGTYGHQNPATARVSMDAQEDVIVARGDIIRGSSAPAAESLSLGSSGQLLKSDGTDVAWATVLTGLSQIEVIRKTADETVNNSTTLQDDDHLLTALAANEIVYFTAHIVHVGNTTADFRMAFTVPTGATLLWSIVNARIDTADAAALGVATSTSGGSLTMGGSTTNVGQLVVGSVRNGATPGNLQLQWAQGAATVVDTKVLTDSFMVLLRV